MFCLTQPSERQIEEFRSRAAAMNFSYTAVGTTRTEDLPAGYVVDRNRIELGEGRETFEKAVTAIQRWQMFDLGWVKLLSEKPPQEGLVVVIRAAQLGFWSLNSCRVVYIIDERVGTVGDGVATTKSRFKQETITYGFGYGTLTDHAESGEERFLIEWDQSTNKVNYDILAFSKPANVLVSLGYPLARRMQKRFASESKATMLQAVR